MLSSTPFETNSFRSYAMKEYILCEFKDKKLSKILDPDQKLKAEEEFELA
jgi:hypothetical protein